MLKNVATTLTVYCWDATTGLPKTGDAANLTAYVSLDFDATPDALADTSATEVDSTNAKGFYRFALAQGETNGDINLYTCKSSTANVVCMCVPALVHTLPTTGLLAPTTAGRTLDVSATGEAGLDFGNVAIPDGPVPIAGIIEGGTAQSATATTLVMRSGSVLADNVAIGSTALAFGSDQGYWQQREVTDNTLSTDTLVVDAWDVTPTGTITYLVFAGPPASTNVLAQINAEMLDVLSVDTFAQPGQESPAATQTLSKMLAYLYKAWRNRHTQTASEYALYADDGTTKDQEAGVTDNGTTFDRAEIQTGA